MGKEQAFHVECTTHEQRDVFGTGEYRSAAADGGRCVQPVIVCPACDLAHRFTAAPASGRRQCARCRAPLQRRENISIDTALALAVCALVLLVLSNAYPLVAMQVNGSSRDTTLIGAALGFYAQGFGSLAALVFLTTVVAPLLQIGTLLYVLIPTRQRRRAFGEIAVLRLLMRVRTWNFMEVFMLGAIVALVRLSNFAHIAPGIALWSCALLMLCLSALSVISSPEQLWRWVERSRD
jgi:paraquat-inducible protein A